MSKESFFKLIENETSLLTAHGLLDEEQNKSEYSMRAKIQQNTMILTSITIFMPAIRPHETNYHIIVQTNCKNQTLGDSNTLYQSKRNARIGTNLHINVKIETLR